MESTDSQILGLLASDGRISYTDIGRETGLSTSAAQQRVRRLEARGVITGYRVEVNPEALGKMLTAFVELHAVDPVNDDTVPQVVAQIPGVVSCYSVAGEASHLLKVQVATPSELEALLTRVRKEGRVSTRSSLVLSTAFENVTPLPDADLESGD